MLRRGVDVLDVKESVVDKFMLILGDNIFNANLQDLVRRQREDQADAAFLVEAYSIHYNRSD